MNEDQVSPLIQEEPESPLVATPVVAKPATSSQKNFALLASLRKLSAAGEKNYLQALKEGYDFGLSLIEMTGSEEELKKQAVTEEMIREVGVGQKAGAVPEFLTPFLSETYQKLQDNPYLIEQGAAETISLLPEIAAEYEGFENTTLPPSVIELQMDITARRLALVQEQMKQGEALGLEELGERDLWDLPRTAFEFVMMNIPVMSQIPRGGNIPSQVNENLGDNFFPGDIQNREAAVLMDPTITSWEEFQKLAPEFVKNTYAQTNQQIPLAPLGTNIQNKLFQEMLVYESGDTPSELELNTIAALDYAGLALPYVTKSAKLLDSVNLLKTARLNGLAADVAAEVVGKGRVMGAAAAAEASMTTVEAVEDAALVRILNPDGTLSEGLSLAGRVDSRLQEIDEVVKELQLIRIDDFNRLTEEELQKAIAAKLRQVEDRVGRKINVADVREVNGTPGTGIHTPVLEVAIGTKQGKGFQSLRAVNKFAESIGLSGYRIKYITRANGQEGVDVGKLPPMLDETIAGLPERISALDEVEVLKARPPNTRAGSVSNSVIWSSKQGLSNDELLAQLKDHVKYTGNSVEILFTKDGNIIAGSVDDFGGRLRQLLGFTDDEVGRNFLPPSKVNKLSMDDLKAGAIRKDGKGFAFKDQGESKVQTTETATGSVVRDENSGEYFLLFQTGVDEKTFFTPITPKGEKFHFGAARLFAGGRLLEGDHLFGMGSLAESRRNGLVNILNKTFAPRFKALKKEEFKLLDTIARVEDHEARWMDDTELSDLYVAEFGIGSDPTKFIDAHRAFQQINDIEYFLRNASVYSELSTRGFSTVSLKGVSIGDFAARTARVETDLVGARPRGPVFDATEGKMVNLSDLDRKAYQDKGYVLVRYLNTELFGDDGHISRYALVKKTQMEESPLAYNQLGYRPGGHRIYDETVRYWIKGAQVRTQPSTGKEVLLNPTTILGGQTREELVDFLNDLNEYVILAEKHLNNKTATDMRSTLVKFRSGRPNLPDTEDILKMVKDGRASSKNPFEIVEDRKLPSQYTTDPEKAMYVDTDANPVYEHMRDMGRLFYSKRGDNVMMDYRGEDLPVVNVHDTIERSLSNITGLVSYSPYRISKMERWVAQYQDILDVHPNMSLDEMFNAEFINPQNQAQWHRINAAQAQRSVTRRLFNWTSSRGRYLDKVWNGFLHGIERVTPGVENKRRILTGLSKVGKKIGVNKTATLFKGFAFDVKLGILNFAQPILQVGTSLSIMGIDTTETLRAIGSYPALRLYNPRRDEALMRSVLNGVNGPKILSGMDVEEFIAMANNMKLQSSFDLVTKSSSILDQATEGKQFSLIAGIGDKFSRLREGIRFMYYESEKLNKMVAYQVAWRKIRKSNPDLAYTSQAFKEKVSGMASTLAHGMDNISSAAWQKNPITSPMMQFFQYPIRVLEMGLGTELTYVEKLRYFAAQGILFGSAGVVGASFLDDQENAQEGPKSWDSNFIETLGERGLIDAALYYGTGADVLYGERVGTGRFVEDVLREFLGLSRFGPVSPADFTGGASYSIFFDMVNGYGNVLHYFDLRMNNGDKFELDEGWGLVAQSASDANKYISSWSNYTKARTAWETGMLFSRRRPEKSATFLAEDLNKAEAVFLLLGLNPASSRDISSLIAANSNRKQTVSEYAGTLDQIDKDYIIALQKGYRTGDYSDAKRLEDTLRAFWIMIPQEYHTEVKDLSDRYDESESLIKGLTEGWEEGQKTKQIRAKLEQQMKENQ